MDRRKSLLGWEGLEMVEPDVFEKCTMIDPPSGWQYGFPKPLPNEWREPNFDLRQWLIDNEYPEEEVDFGMKYCRYFGGTIFG